LTGQKSKNKNLTAMKKSAFVFDIPLTEGIVIKRKTQFTINVNVNGKETFCHCPTTERIGDIELAGRPCLLSKSVSSSRKTPYTVEAVSLNRPDDTRKLWIGINQNAANRYVEHYLDNGGFSKMVGRGEPIQREQFLGASKLDFLIGNTYLEVKTPLQTLQVKIPDYINRKKTTPLSSTGRFIKHMTELANSLKSHQRAILLLCFLYNNPGFKPVEKSVNTKQVSKAVKKAAKSGVETWQVNFNITPNGVELVKYFELPLIDS
jgi:sugar fermentation stimulation protein A